VRRKKLEHELILARDKSVNELAGMWGIVKEGPEGVGFEDLGLESCTAEGRDGAKGTVDGELLVRNDLAR
jgi:hypothetical protein